MVTRLTYGNKKLPHKIIQMSKNFRKILFLLKNCFLSHSKTGYVKFLILAERDIYLAFALKKWP